MIKKTLLVIFIAISAAAGYAQTGGGNNGKGSTMRTEVLVDTKDQPVSTYEFTYDANTAGKKTSSVTLKYDGNGNLTVQKVQGADGQSRHTTAGRTTAAANVPPPRETIERGAETNNQAVIVRIVEYQIIPADGQK
jgi:hypothetical protein